MYRYLITNISFEHLTQIMNSELWEMKNNRIKNVVAYFKIVCISI